jgi:hypothetical protein
MASPRSAELLSGYLRRAQLRTGAEIGLSRATQGWERGGRWRLRQPRIFRSHTPVLEAGRRGSLDLWRRGARIRAEGPPGRSISPLHEPPDTHCGWPSHGSGRRGTSCRGSRTRSFSRRQRAAHLAALGNVTCQRSPAQPGRGSSSAATVCPWAFRS